VQNQPRVNELCQNVQLFGEKKVLTKIFINDIIIVIYRFLFDYKGVK